MKEKTNKHKSKTICQVNLGNVRARQGPIWGPSGLSLAAVGRYSALRTLQASKKMIISVSKNDFLMQISLKLHKNNFVFKICVWISVFRRKKRFENPIIGCRDIKQKSSTANSNLGLDRYYKAELK